MSLSGDVVVREVEDAGATMRRMPKNRDARWVAGLTPDDEREAVSPDYQQELDRQMQAAGPDFPETKWLRWPSALLTLAAGVAHLPHVVDLDLQFPVSDAASWPLAREAAMELMLARLVLHVVVALILFRVVFVLARASQLFVAFLGCGWTALAMLGALTNGVLLYRACPTGITDDHQCFLPFVLHWISSLCETFAPCLSSAAAAYVIDYVAASSQGGTLWHPLSLRWTVIGSAPMLALVGGVGMGVYTGNAALAQKWVGHALALRSASWALLAWRLTKQAPFRATVEKPHQD